MITVKFKFVQMQGKYGVETRCTHIQFRENGEFVKFAKHTPELIVRINETSFILPEK